MALVTHKFKLDLTPGASRQVLYTSQGDIGRPFEADLYWNGSPWTATGTTANIRGKKPDDTVFDYTATVSGTAVTFETTEQMTIVSGPVECELVFSNDGDVIASANFVLMVEESPYNPDALSESDIPGIVDLIEDTIGGDVRDEVDALIEENPELMLQDNSVTTPKIAAGAVTEGKIASNAVTTGKLATGAVTSVKVDADFLKTIKNEYVTPEMHGYPTNIHALTDAIADALANNKMLVCYNPVTLTENTDMTGVRVKATKIVLNNHDLLLGGDMAPDQADASTGYTDPDQSFGIIARINTSDIGKVYVRNCHGIHIYIGQAREVYFRTNNTQKSCAYSTFEFKYVDTINIDADTLNPDGTTNIISNNIATYGNWFNENKFLLNRCVTFIESEKVSFGHNVIDGGCFEGVYTIQLENARNNKFIWIRGETSLSYGSKIVLGTKTNNNTLMLPLLYPKTVKDDGYSNRFIYEEFSNGAIIVNDYVSVEDVANGNVGRFNVVQDTDNNSLLKFNGSSGTIIWQSPLLTKPDKKYFAVYASANNYGIPIYFELYDENMEKITDITSALYSLITGQSAYENGSEGSYVSIANPTSQCNGTARDVTNDLAVIAPTGNFVNMSAEQRARIKYVRFGIKQHAYFNSDQTRFKSLIVNVGDTEGTQSVKFHVPSN